jgi:hypothetical protein
MGAQSPAGRARITHLRSFKREGRGIKLSGYRHGDDVIGSGVRRLFADSCSPRAISPTQVASRLKITCLGALMRAPWRNLQLCGFLALCLAACSPPPESVITKCEYEVRRTYPTDDMVMSSRIQHLMLLCMKTEGYKMTLIGGCECKPPPRWTDGNNPYVDRACYEYFIYLNLKLWLADMRIIRFETLFRCERAV